MLKAFDKVFFPLLFAAAMDGFQLLMSVSLLAAGMVGGAAAPVAGAGTGAGAGCVVGGTFGAIGGAAGAGIGAIPGAIGGCAVGGAVGGTIGGLVGSAAAIAISPLGLILGFVVNVSISLTFGLALITFLWLSDVLYPKTVLGFLFSETILGFNNLPLWTGLVLTCGFKKVQEESGAAGKAARVAEVLLKPTPGSVLRAVRPRPVDGIAGRS